MERIFQEGNPFENGIAGTDKRGILAELSCYRNASSKHGIKVIHLLSNGVFGELLFSINSLIGLFQSIFALG